jgi:hypothetical protein
MTEPKMRLVYSDGTYLDTPAAIDESDHARIEEQARPGATHRLGVEDVYPDPGTRPPELNTALNLLYEADRELDQAVSELRSDNKLEADDATQRFFALLPELFCCRSLGDGFGLIVSSMFHGVQNLEGMPADEEQLLAFVYTTQFARRHPFCSSETAAQVVEKLSESGLNVDPPGLQLIANELDEEVFR